MEPKTFKNPKPARLELQKLPIEILLLIANNIDDTKTLYSLTLTNRQLPKLFTSILLKLAYKTDKSSRAALF